MGAWALAARGLVVWAVALLAPMAGSAMAQCARTEVQKLHASDGRQSNLFGWSVAMDGDRAVIGAYDTDVGTGAAYVFDWNGTTWAETARLTSTSGVAGDAFGYAVAVHGDRVVVGAIGDDDGGDHSGSACVFEWNGAAWVETKLIAADASAGDYFGFKVSISGDRVIVGAFYDDNSNGIEAGAAYVFEHDGAAWGEVQKLTASDGSAFDHFGYAVSISGDRAAVGAVDDYRADSSNGSVYVFERSGGTWVETAKLFPGDVANGDDFGVSVAISGARLIAGAARDDDLGNASGSAYVFAWDGHAWAEQAKLTAFDGKDVDYFGQSVSLSGDHAVVGAYQHDELSDDSGAAYAFNWDGQTWVSGAKLVDANGGSFDSLGNSVAVSGERAIAGAWSDNDQGEDSGSACVFDVPMKSAVWTNYGSGWPGTLGIPSFTAESDPGLGSDVLLDLESSSPTTTLGVVLMGRGRASLPTQFDGTLLVGPFTPATPRFILTLRPGITVLGLAIPDDPILRGKRITFQAIEGDRGASKGLAFTPGLELIIGDC